jgi:hypothetical protein
MMMENKPDSIQFASLSPDGGVATVFQKVGYKRSALFKVGDVIEYSPRLPRVFKPRPSYTIIKVDAELQVYTLMRVGSIESAKKLHFNRQGHYRLNEITEKL